MSGETGGCQCGAVRFKVTGTPGRPSVCHCRMCQKAFAAPYAALVTVKVRDLVWTRGAPAHFQSSDQVRRGFCPTCGTPLTFEWSPGAIDLAICAFDEPAGLTPTIQMATDQALAWARGVADLPEREGAEQAQAEQWFAAIISHQHPDHDTEAWPPVPPQEDKT